MTEGTNHGTRTKAWERERNVCKRVWGRCVKVWGRQKVGNNWLKGWEPKVKVELGNQLR